MSPSHSISKYYDAQSSGRVGRDLDYDYDRQYALRSQEARASLDPLIRQIQTYDFLRRKLETEGGHLADLNAITRVLTETFCLKGFYKTHEVALVHHGGLRAALLSLGDYDLHLDVRQLETHMPVYYLCRVRRDYWSEYSMVVEDVYLSPGYPLIDARFVRLMSQGREAYYLRLSQFRDAVAAMASEGGARGEGRGARESQSPTALEPRPSGLAPAATASPTYVDGLLYDLGRYVFQAAWHEDQRVGLLTAEHFSLPRFRDAIELLYLCLSGELCELRSAINDGMLSFFERVYPQPAIAAFLRLLTGLDGGALSGIPQKALKEYAKLSKAFGKLVEIQVPWGARRVGTPLYKLLFGNLSRLALVGDALRSEDEVVRAGKQLEKVAQRVIDELVAPTSPSEGFTTSGG